MDLISDELLVVGPTWVFLPNNAKLCDVSPSRSTSPPPSALPPPPPPPHPLTSIFLAYPLATSSPSSTPPTRTMHRLLAIHEILGLIARNLSAKEQRDMALVCRTFYEPAMDELWHTIESLAPLILCLPPRFRRWVYWVEADPPTLFMTGSTELERHDWDRVQHHARRVRVVLTGSHGVLSPHFCRFIRDNYPYPCLLPNLRRFNFSDAGCAAGTTLFLIQPSLRHVHHQVSRIPPPYEDWHSVNRIANDCLDVRVLSIVHVTCECISETGYCEFLFPQAAKALSNAVQSSNYLTEVRFSTSFDHDAILHLSALPHLTTLGLQLGEANCQPLDSADSGASFPALSILEVKADDAKQLAPWLRAVRLPSLTTLSISVSSLSPIPLAEDLIDAVSCFAGLQYLYIRFVRTSKDVASLKYPASEAILQPLFRKLPLIAEFALSGLVCNPARKTVFAMALGWPSLRKLRLNWTCYAKASLLGQAGYIFPRDLLLLARHCPSLETISITLSRGLQSEPGTLSVYDEADFEDEAVAVDPTSGRIILKSRADQDRLHTTPLNVADVVKHTPLPVSNLLNLELHDAFRFPDWRCIAQCLSEVFPRVQLIPRCRRGNDDFLNNCVATIMDLKKGYILMKMPILAKTAGRRA